MEGAISCYSKTSSRDGTGFKAQHTKKRCANLCCIGQPVDKGRLGWQALSLKLVCQVQVKYTQHSYELMSFQDYCY